MSFLTPLRRRLLAALAVLVAGAGAGAVAVPALAASGDGGGDTSAVAVNTKDGSTLFRFAFSVRQIMGDVVDGSNTAIAYASCEECQTVAISIQVLLVSGSPDEVTPTNLAVALNEECDDCQTLASAYQFIFGNGEALRFTGEGRRAIADIRRRFLALRREGLTIEEIQARADELAVELREVLITGVTTRGGESEQSDTQGGGDLDAGEAEGSQSGDSTAPRRPSGDTPTTTQPPPRTTTQPPPTRTQPPPDEPTETQSPPTQTTSAPEQTRP